MLSTGDNYIASSGTYSKTLKRVIILTSNGWEDITEIKHGDNGRVGVGTTTPGAALDVRGAIISGLPWFFARNQTFTNTNVSSYNVTSTHLQDGNSTLGTMYSTSYACLFPIKGIYVVDVRVHSVFVGGHTSNFDGNVRYSNGTVYYPVSSPRSYPQSTGNYDTFNEHTWLITTDEDNMYFDLSHTTSIACERNYAGNHNRIRGACIYAL